MKHLKKNRKFGREKGPRKALIRSLMHNLIIHNKIKTTEAKAKEIKPMIEKLITRAKNRTVYNKRIIAEKIPNEKDVKKLFEEIAPKYKERHGGYAKIIKIPKRKTDAAKMAIIEFV